MNLISCNFKGYLIIFIKLSQVPLIINRIKVLLNLFKIQEIIIDFSIRLYKLMITLKYFLYNIFAINLIKLN